MRVARFVYRVHLFFPHPERGTRHLYIHSLRQSLASSATPSPSIVGRRLHFAPFTTNDRCGCRVDRLCPATTLTLFFDTCAALRLSKTLSSIYGYKLSLTAALPLTAPPPLRSGVAPPPLRCQPDTSACYSGSSSPCRCAPFSGRRKMPHTSLLPPIGD